MHRAAPAARRGDLPRAARQVAHRGRGAGRAAARLRAPRRPRRGRRARGSRYVTPRVRDVHMLSLSEFVSDYLLSDYFV